MMIEDPLALQYIFTDNVYLLPQDKILFNSVPAVAPCQPAITQPELPAAVTFEYKGGYQKKILVLVHYPDHEAMEPAHLSALESTIKRKELSLDDIAIFNLHKHTNSAFEAVITFFNPQKMLILGKSSLPDGLASPPLNELIKLGNCPTLYSFSFSEMMGNKDNTKAFWEQMKAL